VTHQGSEDREPAGIVGRVREGPVVVDQDGEVVESAFSVDEVQSDYGRDQRRGAVREDRVIDDVGRAQGAALRPEPSPGREELEEALFVEDRGITSLGDELEPVEVVRAEGQEVRQLPYPGEPLSSQELHRVHPLVLGEV
jgi:hypothetical protein